MVSTALFFNLLLATAISIDESSAVLVLTTTTNTQCDRSVQGKVKSFKNRMGESGILICSKSSSDGVFRWKNIDGSSTVGEKFNPARDCSDIVDRVPEATDGFYWISLTNGKLHKVWCNVHTDGGGFMLVGMKDTPASWKVPTKASTVNPAGPAQWSSLFGKFKVQEFAVQISMNNSFKGTRAHWLYRLEPKRALGNLFGVGKGGCTDVHSGIGNIAFVKDLLTSTVVTTTFNCSKFGPHMNVALGWARMNHCLKNSCPSGYAFLPGISLQLDNFGSFSYSTTSPLSGITHDSTAFVGCVNHKCCACYGPKGGRQNYCGKFCTAMNGGTVTKQAYVWFWIRTRVPRRVWKRCMEFTMKTDEGKLETFFIDRKTRSAHKGSCSKHFRALLNEGTLSVSDKESLENIPPIPGLLSYRNDNKKLYVNNGSRWEPLSSEKEVEKLKARIKILEERTAVLPSCSRLRKKFPDLPSGFYKINPGGNNGAPFEVLCDMSSKNGVGVTAVAHDSEQRTLVDGFEAKGSYKKRVTYGANLADIAALATISKHCEQFIKYECLGSTLGPGDYAWWVSRQGGKMSYWGGAKNCGTCACKLTNSCADANSCNCDKEDHSRLHEDAGFLTDKTRLPVTELRFGDTGDPNEFGFHNLGKLLCWG